MYLHHTNTKERRKAVLKTSDAMMFGDELNMKLVLVETSLPEKQEQEAQGLIN